MSFEQQRLQPAGTARPPPLSSSHNSTADVFYTARMMDVEHPPYQQLTSQTPALPRMSHVARERPFNSLIRDSTSQSKLRIPSGPRTNISITAVKDTCAAHGWAGYDQISIIPPPSSSAPYQDTLLGVDTDL
ncbi:hypothetical protein J6590_052509 [Homalodisca vitripennis]|nr:hypothetical protein J6590_052509 [Homalodisca vitripennis]